MEAKARTIVEQELELTRPRIGITMGDPAGIGPEVILNALNSIGDTDRFTPLVIGDYDYLKKVGEGLRESPKVIRHSNDVESKGIRVFDLGNIDSEIAVGIESASAGKVAGEYIETAVDLWKKGEIDGVVTAPINKNALKLGGYDYQGHTEFLADLTGVNEFAMSFFAGSMAVVLLSTHVSLREAIGLIKKDALIDLIRFSERSLRELMHRNVKIAVAGLNPHASENGNFGYEEKREISPAIEYCKEDLGIDVSGPYSPDTVFLNAFKGAFDAVISCYHDQATIAVKCLSFGASVNVTLGLPFVRTSVDHGTAFDIAGLNIADWKSMEAALFLASDIINKRRNSR